MERSNKSTFYDFSVHGAEMLHAARKTLKVWPLAIENSFF